jgi:hypothetical protein
VREGRTCVALTLQVARCVGPNATRDDSPVRNGPLYGATATWE